MGKQYIAHLYLLGATLIYGGNYSIAKIAMDNGNIQPMAFIMLRVISGLLLFWIFHSVFVKESIQRTDFVKIILCSIFGIAINQSFFFIGLNYTTPISASLIMTTCPIFVLVFSALLLRESITPQKMLGLVISALGAICLIAYGKQVRFDQSQALGNLLITLNAASYGLYLVLVKSLMKKYHPITVVKWVFTFGMVWVFPFGIQDLLETPFHTFSNPIWYAIAYVLIGTTFLTYLFNALALKSVNSSTTGIYIYLQPFIAAIIAILLQQDELDMVKILAGIAIFLGVFLVSSQPLIGKAEAKL